MKVSIIIRSYNSQYTIKRAIESALNQDFTLKDFEIVVVDDGSKDRTLEFINDYKKLTNLSIYSQKHKGFIKTANLGFEMSKGEYIVLLDGDDYFRPTLIKDLSLYLDKHKEVDMVYPDYFEEIDNLKKKITPQNVFETITGGILYRKKFLSEAGFFRKDVLFAEYDLLLRMYHKLRPFHYPKPLYVYCRRKDSISSRHVWFDKAINQLKILHPNHLGEILKIRSYKID